MSSGNYRTEGNTVIITYDPNSKEKSNTGKSYLLASSGGYKWEGDIGIQFNIIKKVPKP